MTANLPTMHKTTIRAIVQGMHGELPDDMTINKHKNWDFQLGEW